MSWMQAHRRTLCVAAVGFAIPATEAVVMVMGWTFPAALPGELFLVLTPALIAAFPTFVEADPAPGTPLFCATMAFVAGLNAVIYAAIFLFVTELLRNARRAKKIRRKSWLTR
jgi:hypothetical protein